MQQAVADLAAPATAQLTADGPSEQGRASEPPSSCQAEVSGPKGPFCSFGSRSDMLQLSRSLHASKQGTASAPCSTCQDAATQLASDAGRLHKPRGSESITLDSGYQLTLYAAAQPPKQQAAPMQPTQAMQAASERFASPGSGTECSGYALPADTQSTRLVHSLAPHSRTGAQPGTARSLTAQLHAPVADARAAREIAETQHVEGADPADDEASHQHALQQFALRCISTS